MEPRSLANTTQQAQARGNRVGVVGPQPHPAFAYRLSSDDDEEEDAPDPTTEPAEGEVKVKPGLPVPTKAAARTPLGYTLKPCVSSHQVLFHHLWYTTEPPVQLPTGYPYSTNLSTTVWESKTLGETLVTMLPGL